MKLVLVLKLAKYYKRFQQKQLNVKTRRAASARLRSLCVATADCGFLIDS